MKTTGVSELSQVGNTATSDAPVARSITFEDGLGSGVRITELW